MRKIGISQAEIDSTKIIEDNDDFLVVPAIIAREGVFKHQEGMVYYPADELKKAAWTADGAWIVAEQHPDTLIVMNPEDIKGHVEKPFFCDKINGVWGHLRFDKKRNDPTFIADVKAGKRKDVSWGYFYDEDLTPGEWKGQHYDSARRNFLVDHVAAGVPLGRCHSPYCGIAVDQLIRKPAADPWEETEDNIRSGHRDASDTCRTDTLSEEQGIKAIICKYGDKWEYQSYLFAKAKGWTMEKAKTWFAEHKQGADAEWDTEYINNLPDSCFAVIESGGEKDGEGKTTPRSLRHLPYKNGEGNLDADHVRNALARLPQTDLSAELKAEAKRKLCAAAKELKIESEVCNITAADCLDPYKEIERARRLLES